MSNTELIESRLGRTIKLFLLDGDFSGLVRASIFGWTGIVYTCKLTSIGSLLEQNEVKRTGIYVLYGQDPDNSEKKRVYIGSGNSVSKRVSQSIDKDKNSFCETIFTVTTSDDDISKGHAEYLESRVIGMANDANIVTRNAKDQNPDPKNRALPKSDEEDMERFILDLKTIFPVVGLEMISKMHSNIPVSKVKRMDIDIKLEVRERKFTYAEIFVKDGKFIVPKGSYAKGINGNKLQNDSYKKIREELIKDKTLVQDKSNHELLLFAKTYVFNSPSAAASVIRNADRSGPRECKVSGTNKSYGDWQQEQAKKKKNDS